MHRALSIGGFPVSVAAQRHLALAADAELRRRNPGQHYAPLRSAEPQPGTDTQRAELTLTAGQPPGEMGQWITDLAAAGRAFAERIADRQSLMIPSEDPGYGDLGQAFLPWPRPGVLADPVFAYVHQCGDLRGERAPRPAASFPARARDRESAEREVDLFTNWQRVGRLARLETILAPRIHA